MRLLHTADWHVGKAIWGRSRMDEYEAALAQLVQVARDERVDAVLIAGDLYEQRAPQPEADRLVIDTLVALHEAHIPVVTITGNHESPARWSALAPLLRRVGVHVVPRVVPPDAGSVIELTLGDERLVAACVPFVPERRFNDAASLFAAGENWFTGYAEGMRKLLGAMSQAFRPDAVNVLLAHLFTDGALVGGGEHPITIGAAYAIPPAALPSTASYIALGHVHEAQLVKGAPGATRYAGSLLQLDFGESEQRKSVYVVETHPGKPATVTPVEITAGRRLVTVRGSLEELRVISATPAVKDAYVRAYVKVPAPVPGLVDRVREFLPDAVRIELDYERPPQEEEAPKGVASLAPREQFLAYYRRVHGEPDPRLLAGFDELLALEQEGD